jgi:murein peptide amidase A
MVPGATDDILTLESASALNHAFQLLTQRSGQFSVQCLSSDLPALCRFTFKGPHGGGDPIRIGFFAGIHGDEPAGSIALLRLAERLAGQPETAEGYELFFYPICNPTGFDARTRCSASGKDLNREFWRNSPEPEVRLLEREIQELIFHGLVSLHSDDTSDGLYGFVRGALLTRSLLEPALAAAEAFLPRNRAALIDGFPAENGIITKCYDGILTSPPKLENSPFEIILETPHHAPVPAQVDAFVAGSLAILAEYRKFISFAADL